MARSVDVAIVGAGPAGLVLAVLLARAGHAVAVVEQNATFEREYRGEGIQPGTRRIFDDLGLRARIEALDHGSPRGLVGRIDGAEVRLDFRDLLGDDPAARSLFIPQPLLLEILADAATTAGAAIAMATAFKALRYSGERVAGIDVVERGDRLESIAAALVVACDGRFSAVRRSIAAPIHLASVPYDLLWFSARAATDANDLVYLEVNGPHLSIAFPSRRHIMQVGWLIPKGASRPPPPELIARAPPEAAASLETEFANSDRVTLLPIASESIDRWWRPGLLFIGDAAHPMSPVGAQGINVAVQDAVVAARHIAPALTEGPTIDRALAAIERARAGSVRRIARQQNALPAALHRFGPGRILRIAIGAATIAQRSGVFSMLGGPLLDRFLWGDPPIRADTGPWIDAAKDSRSKSR